MSRQPKTYISPEEYLAVERKSETKSEYFAGEIYSMVGASREHNLIVANIVGKLTQQLKGKPPEVYASRMRVRVRLLVCTHIPTWSSFATSRNLKMSTWTLCSIPF